MTEVPKIVYDRLRAARPERALLGQRVPGQALPGQTLPGQTVPGQTVPEPTHPDADLLTAFAEQALSATERNGVLEHLALCGDCREVVALTLPDAAAPAAADAEAPQATAIPAKSHWNWLSSTRLAWPGLRWAALAAGVALAASVLLLHPGKLNQATLPSAKQVAPAALPAAGPGPQIASSPVASPPMDQSSVSAKAASVKTDAARTKPESAPSKKLKPATPLGVQSGMLLALNSKGSSPGNQRPAAPSPAASGLRSGASAETVEVTGAAEAVAVAPSPEDKLMARNDAPAIEKAKPALPETEVNELRKTPGAAAAPAARLQSSNVMSTAKIAPSSNQFLTHNVTWAIKAGALQRSLDNGQSWQNALRADHPLLCYASHAADIWAGGQTGTLFHSSDHGLTWVQVQPSVKAQALTSDVTRIDIRDEGRGPVEIVVSTSNNEIWSSADGGKTWVKQ